MQLKIDCSLQRPGLTKTLLIMKFTAILLFVAAMQVSGKGYSQITLSFKNTPLANAFQEIEKQSGYSFVYGKEQLLKAKSVTFTVTDEKIETVLALLFAEQPLSYTISGKYIAIKEKISNQIDKRNLLIETSTIDITGRITNSQGEPLAGANVIIKRINRGTSTDANGKFSLRGINSDDILNISYVGYKTISTSVGSNTFLNIVMEIATSKLDEVKIQAYGTTTDRFRTGNVSTVLASEIEKQPVLNVLQGLQARVPGLNITQNSGYASAPISVELRGRSVINPNLPTEPLYIVDGVPLTILTLGTDNYASGSSGFTQNDLRGPANGQSPIFSINPSDIESISVLKDADATAIYGSRGGNGVIIITTKKGKIGNPTLDISINRGISKVTRFYKMLNTEQYLLMRKEALINDGIAPDINNAYDLLLWDSTRYTDFQKVYWGGHANTTDIQMGFSGGDKITTFRVGIGYLRQTSLNTIDGSDQRGSIQFNLSTKTLNQKFKVNFTSLYSFTYSDLIALGGGVTNSPNTPAIFDSQGKLNFKGWAPVSYQFNFGSLLQPYVAKTNFLNSQLKLEYQVVKGLNISTSVGYSTNKTAQKSIEPIVSQDPANNPTGRAIFGNNNGSRIIFEPQLVYDKLIGAGQFTALFGGTYQAVNQDGNRIVGSGYVNDNLINSISNAPVVSATDSRAEYKYFGTYARITYNWKKKLILNFSARRDGSSKFGDGKQFGNFGAFGTAYIFTEENWFKNHLKFLSFGKVRVSYGITGSDNIGNYEYLTRWSSLLPYQQGNPAYVPLQHANPNLQWQEDKKLECAINLSFLNDKINTEISWYQNRIGNQLIPFPLPSITGFNYVTANFPATVQNTGIEASLSAKLIQQKSTELELVFNIGMNKNKLLSFPGIEESPFASIYKVGESLNRSPMLHFTGVDPQTGLYTFEDINKDGQIKYTGGSNSDDDIIFKDLNIKYDGGFGANFRYKNFEANLFLQFRNRLGKSNVLSNGFPGQPVNQSVEVLDRWQQPGDQAKFAKFTTIGGDSYYFFQVSDRTYTNASFLRLNNLSFSYSLPAKWVNKAGMKNLKIYFRGQNLFVFHSYDGPDPETRNFGGMPPLTTYMAGIQINF